MKSGKALVSRSSAAVVTGAGSGIGRSFAVEIARRGGSVICSDIRMDRAEETVAIIRRAGGKPMQSHATWVRPSRSAS